MYYVGKEANRVRICMEMGRKQHFNWDVVFIWCPESGPIFWSKQNINALKAPTIPFLPLAPRSVGELTEAISCLHYMHWHNKTLWFAFELFSIATMNEKSACKLRLLCVLTDYNVWNRCFSTFNRLWCSERVWKRKHSCLCKLALPKMGHWCFQNSPFHFTSFSSNSLPSLSLH